MENFSELIKNRRSMRKFTDEELSQEQVVTLLKAALMAPTSKRSNGWQFIAVDDKETLEKLSHCKEQASAFIADAALAIVVTADPLVSDVWIVAGYKSVNAMLLPACRRTNMCVAYLIYLCNFRFCLLSPSDTKAWNVNLLTKATCSGRKFILINSEENNSECC